MDIFYIDTNILISKYRSESTKVYHALRDERRDKTTRKKTTRILKLNAQGICLRFEEVGEIL